MRPLLLLILTLIAASAAGCASRNIEATSLTGRPLERPTIPPEVEQRMLAQLEQARRAFDANPEDEMSIIWYGRRLAYLARYDEAIQIYTNGLASNPRSFKLLRHRGHRYITVRNLDHAIDDLTRAENLMRGVPDEAEPDGQPNDAGIPRSTTRTNILYHLGLAYYLKGDFETAAEVYGRCLAAAVNDDNRVSSSYWLVLSRMRSGQIAESDAVLARITPDMDVIENDVYHRLLLMFKGGLDPSEVAPGASDGVQDATAAYGIAAWRMITGDDEARADATKRFREIVDAAYDSGAWAAFGCIAAEAELSRARQ